MAVVAADAYNTRRSHKRITTKEELQELLDLHPEAVRFQWDQGGYTAIDLPVGTIVTVRLSGERQGFAAVWSDRDGRLRVT